MFSHLFREWPIPNPPIFCAWAVVNARLKFESVLPIPTPFALLAEFCNLKDYKPSCLRFEWNPLSQFTCTYWLNLEAISVPLKGCWFVQSHFLPILYSHRIGLYRTIAKKVFWEFTVVQKLSDILPLVCPPTWPSHHVSENLEFVCKEVTLSPFFPLILYVILTNKPRCCWIGLLTPQDPSEKGPWLYGVTSSCGLWRTAFW